MYKSHNIDEVINTATLLWHGARVGGNQLLLSKRRKAMVHIQGTAQGARGKRARREVLREVGGPPLTARLDECAPRTCSLPP